MNFRIVERVFSEDNSSPTILIANIYGLPNVEKNLKKMEQIIEIAHQKKVNIVVFPELSVTGYIWKANDPEQVWDRLAEGENSCRLQILMKSF